MSKTTKPKRNSLIEESPPTTTPEIYHTPIPSIEGCQLAILGFNRDELDTLIRSIRFRRSQLSLIEKDKFSVGDDVWFPRTKDGEIVEGKITKIHRKNINVKVEPFTNWTVSPSLLHLQKDLSETTEITQ